MKWSKTTEYRTYITINEQTFTVIASKEEDDRLFAVCVNGSCIVECEQLPTREFIEEMILEDEEIQNKINTGYGIS